MYLVKELRDSWDRKFMTVKQVAEFLQLGVRTIYEMAERSELPCSKIRGQWRFDRDLIIAWVNSNTVEEPIKLIAT